MQYRKFGNTNLNTSEIALGCNNLGNIIFSSSKHDPYDQLIAKSIELGINVFDTAPHYSYGDSENILGQNLRGKRKDVYIVSKCGRLLSSLAKKGKAVRRFKKIIGPIISPFRSNLKSMSKSKFDFSPSAIEISVNQSLKRLQTDYIDLLLLHNPSLHVLKKGEVFEVLEKLKRSGQIRYYGASIDSLDEFDEAIKYPIDALQIHYNIIQNSMAKSLIRKLNKACGIMVKTPLMRGFLTDKRYLKTEYYPKKDVQVIKDKRQQLEFLSSTRSWSKIAINYPLLEEKVSTVLCGTSSIKHLIDNCDYSNMPTFTKEEMAKINQIQKSTVL